MHMYGDACLWAVGAQLSMKAEMPLPADAVPLLQKPIGSTLRVHGFIREKEGGEVGRKSEGDEVGAKTTGLQFS